MPSATSTSSLPGTLDVCVGDQSVTLLPHRAAFWHRERTLLVADLHLGKAETFAHAGVALPAALGEEPLTRLGEAIRITGASRVLVLGDLLHAPAGLTDTLVGRVAEWRREHAHVRFELVPGNHDRRVEALAGEWGLMLHAQRYVRAPFAFTHDPAHADPSCQPVGLTWWCGHLHPVVRLASRSDSLRLPAFILHEAVCVLPAFNRFTGGAPLRAGYGQRVYAIADGAVVGLGPAGA